MPIVAGHLDPAGLSVPYEEDFALPDLEQKWNDEWDATLLSAALERLRNRVEPKHFQLFELSVVKDWPIEKICSVLNVSAGRVYLVRHRIMTQLKKELAYLNTKHF